MSADNFGMVLFNKKRVGHEQLGIYLSPAGAAKTNSPLLFRPLAFYKGDEKEELLRTAYLAAFAPLCDRHVPADPSTGKQSYPTVRDREIEVDGTTYTLRFFQAADAKLNSETLGHGGQSSRHNCYWWVGCMSRLAVPYRPPLLSAYNTTLCLPFIVPAWLPACLPAALPLASRFLLPPACLPPCLL